MPDDVTVESYADVARALWADPEFEHGVHCPCIACADLRCHQRRILPALVIAGRAIPTLSLGRRLP
jgi:hypothetical protein